MESCCISGKWEGKVAVVTGASVGIGASIAKSLANAGMLVIGIARRAELIEELATNVSSSSGKICARRCDVTNVKEVTETFQWIKDSFGIIDVFVNNAGIMKAAFLIDSPTEDIRSLYDINTVAASICIREAIGLMRENKSKSHIIIINSILGHRVPDVPIPLFGVYPATKHAITALCQTVRQEIHFHKLNIKLTSISPGMVDTDLLSAFSSSLYAQMPKLKAEDVARAVIYALDTPDNVQINDIEMEAVSSY